MKSFQDLAKELKEKDFVTYNTMEIVSKLMAIRTREGLSQRKLSELTGVSQKTISRMENGVDLPSIETIIKLANGMGYELQLVKKK
jgi:transcriptional regulator with XRE-family HTH domain